MQDTASINYVATYILHILHTQHILHMNYTSKTSYTLSSAITTIHNYSKCRFLLAMIDHWDFIVQGTASINYVAPYILHILHTQRILHMNYTSKTSYTLSSAITTIHNYFKCRFLLTMIDHWDFTVHDTASINYVATYILHILHTQHILHMNYTSKTSYTLSSAITTIHNYFKCRFLLTMIDHWDFTVQDTASINYVAPYILHILHTQHILHMNYTSRTSYTLRSAITTIHNYSKCRFLLTMIDHWDFIVQGTASINYVAPYILHILHTQHILHMNYTSKTSYTLSSAITTIHNYFKCRFLLAMIDHWDFIVQGTASINYVAPYILHILHTQHILRINYTSKTSYTLSSAITTIHNYFKCRFLLAMIDHWDFIVQGTASINYVAPYILHMNYTSKTSYTLSSAITTIHNYFKCRFLLAMIDHWDFIVQGTASINYVAPYILHMNYTSKTSYTLSSAITTIHNYFKCRFLLAMIDHWDFIVQGTASINYVAPYILHILHTQHILHMNYTSKTSYTLSSAITTIHNYFKCRFLLAMIDYWDFTVQDTASINYVAPYILHILHTQHILHMNYTSKTSYTLSTAITTIHNYSKWRYLLPMIDHWDFIVQDTASINHVAPYILHILHTQHILHMNYTSKTSYTLSSAITTIHNYFKCRFLLAMIDYWDFTVQDTASINYVAPYILHILHTQHILHMNYTSKTSYTLSSAITTIHNYFKCRFLLAMIDHWDFIVQCTASINYVAPYILHILHTQHILRINYTSKTSYTLSSAITTIHNYFKCRFLLAMIDHWDFIVQGTASINYVAPYILHMNYTSKTSYTLSSAITTIHNYFKCRFLLAMIDHWDFIVQGTASINYVAPYILHILHTQHILHMNYTSKTSYTLSSAITTIHNYFKCRFLLAMIDHWDFIVQCTASINYVAPYILHILHTQHILRINYTSKTSYTLSSAITTIHNYFKCRFLLAMIDHWDFIVQGTASINYVAPYILHMNYTSKTSYTLSSAITTIHNYFKCRFLLAMIDHWDFIVQGTASINYVAPYILHILHTQHILHMNYTSKTSYTLSSTITTIHNYFKCRFLLAMIDHWDFIVQGTASINYVAPYILHILHTQHILHMNYTSKTSYTLSSAITTIHNYSKCRFLLAMIDHWDFIVQGTASINHVATYILHILHTQHILHMNYTSKTSYTLSSAITTIHNYSKCRFLLTMIDYWDFIVQGTASINYVATYILHILHTQHILHMNYTSKTSYTLSSAITTIHNYFKCRFLLAMIDHWDFIVQGTASINYVAPYILHILHTQHILHMNYTSKTSYTLSSAITTIHNYSKCRFLLAMIDHWDFIVQGTASINYVATYILHIHSSYTPYELYF